MVNATQKPVKGGQLARLAAMLGENPLFRAWIDMRRRYPVGTTTPDAARVFFLEACQVSSRAQIDHQPEAVEMMNKIRRGYLKQQGAALAWAESCGVDLKKWVGE